MTSAVAALQLLRHQSVFDVGHAGAAVAFKAGSEETHFAHEGNELAREAAFAEAVFDDGDDVVFNEVAGRTADEEFVFGEAGVEVEEVEILELERHDCTWL